MTNKICFVKSVLTLTGTEQVANSRQVDVSKLVDEAPSVADITTECERVKCNSEHVLHSLTVSELWHSLFFYLLLSFTAISLIPIGFNDCGIKQMGSYREPFN